MADKRNKHARRSAKKLADGTAEATASVVGTVFRVIGTILLILLVTGLLFMCIFAYYVKNCLSTELVARIRERNQTANGPLLYSVRVDTGACQAVNCRLRRPEVFGGAIGLSGLYDMSRFLGSAEDDLVLRNAPLAYLTETGLVDKKAFAKAEENDLILCAGQGSYEEEAQADTRALSEALTAAGLPAHCEFWGSDVSHDWYWWGKELHLFAERIFEEGGSHA